MTTLEQQIRQIAAEELGIPGWRITLWTRFPDIGADSFAILNLLVALEEKFRIEFPFEKIEQLDSLGSIKTLMETLPGSAGIAA